MSNLLWWQAKGNF